MACAIWLFDWKATRRPALTWRNITACGTAARTMAVTTSSLDRIAPLPRAWRIIFAIELPLVLGTIAFWTVAPAAYLADTVGIDVYRIRYGAVVASGMFAAAGGAYLSIGNVVSFNEQMTDGRGYIALAAVIFGNWSPFGTAAACLLRLRFFGRGAHRCLLFAAV